ncbi:MAG: sulfotransferase [Phycisphaeraceae bacterium]|nr:sulfotransferase [Phycisphaeraceae bacterium]
MVGTMVLPDVSRAPVHVVDRGVAAPATTDPIVIVGAPRSGTTFLAEVLSCHPDLHLVDEPRMIWRYGNDRKSDLLKPEDARPKVIAYIRNTFKRHLTKAGKPRLLEKTPSNALRLPFVERVLPSARIVHIMRNGLDSVLSIESFWRRSAHGLRNVAPGRFCQRLKELSMRRAPYYASELFRRTAPLPLRTLIGVNPWGPRIPGINQMTREMDLLEICCLQWRMCVELSCQFGRTLPPDRYFECRLEDMSPQLMERIFRFCQLPESNAVQSFFQSRFQPDVPSARKRTADPAKVQQVLRWIEPTMKWLGYPLPD